MYVDHHLPPGRVDPTAGIRREKSKLDEGFNAFTKKLVERYTPRRTGDTY